MKYFIVQVKCGHVGTNRYIPIDFPITAATASEAAQEVRMFPRVKHNHPDAILSVMAVSIDDYYRQLEANNNDPYLHIKSKYQQKAILPLIEERIVYEKRSESKRLRTDRSYKVIKYKTIVKEALRQIIEYDWGKN